MKIHEQMKAARRRLRMTQGDVAKAVGIQRVSYTRIERGKSTTVTTMEAIGNVLGLTLIFCAKSPDAEKKSYDS